MAAKILLGLSAVLRTYAALRAESIDVVKEETTSTGSTWLWLKRGRNYAVIECENDGETALYVRHTDGRLLNWAIDETFTMAEAIREIRECLAEGRDHG